jgi:hypothetical protein
MVTGGLVVLVAWVMFALLLIALAAIVLHPGKKE